MSPELDQTAQQYMTLAERLYYRWSNELSDRPHQPPIPWAELPDSVRTVWEEVATESKQYHQEQIDATQVAVLNGVEPGNADYQRGWGARKMAEFAVSNSKRGGK